MMRTIGYFTDMRNGFLIDSGAGDARLFYRNVQ